MKLKLLAVLAAGLMIGADAPADAKAAKEVEKAIQILNDAFAKRDVEAIQRLMTADHLSVTAYYGGPQTKEQQLKDLPDLKLTEYTSHRLKVALLGKDVALVTYMLTQKGTFKGKELAPRNYASAVWVHRDGKWQEAFYQETPLDGK